MRHVCTFAEPEQLALGQNGPTAKDEWPDQVPPYKQFAPAKIDELLAVIRTAIDAVAGNFTMRYAALVVTAAQTDAP